MGSVAGNAMEWGWALEHQGVVIREFVKEPEIEENSNLDANTFKAVIEDPGGRFAQMVDADEDVTLRKDGAVELVGFIQTVESDGDSGLQKTKVEGVSKWDQVWSRSTRNETYENEDPAQIVRRAIGLKYFAHEEFNDQLNVATLTRTRVINGWLELDKDSNGDYFTDADGSLEAISEDIGQGGDITAVTLNATDELADAEDAEVHDDLSTNGNEESANSDAFYEDTGQLVRVPSVGDDQVYPYDDQSNTESLSGGAVIQNGVLTLAGKDWSEDFEAGDSFTSRGDADGKWVQESGLTPPDIWSASLRGYKHGYEIDTTATAPNVGDGKNKHLDTDQAGIIIFNVDGNPSSRSHLVTHRYDKTVWIHGPGVPPMTNFTMYIKTNGKLEIAWGDRESGDDKDIVQDTSSKKVTSGTHWVAWSLNDPEMNDPSEDSTWKVWLDGELVMKGSTSDRRARADDDTSEEGWCFAGYGTDDEGYDATFQGNLIEARQWPEEKTLDFLEDKAKPRGDRGSETGMVWYLDEEDELSGGGSRGINGPGLSNVHSDHTLKTGFLGGAPRISPGPEGPWHVVGDEAGAFTGAEIRAYDTHETDTVIDGLAGNKRKPSAACWDDADGDFSTALIGSPRRLVIVGYRDGSLNGYKYSGGSWSEDTGLVDGLNEIGGYADPTVFELDGTWRCIIGKGGGGFDGYQWDEANNTWTSDSNITSGITGRTNRSSPATVSIDGTWRLLVQGSDGTWDGYDWDSANTTWVSNANLTDGLSDVGDHGSVGAALLDDNPTLVDIDSTGTVRAWVWRRAHDTKDTADTQNIALRLDADGEGSKRAFPRARTFGTLELQVKWESGDSAAFALAADDASAGHDDTPIFALRVNDDGRVQYSTDDELPRQWDELPVPTILTSGWTTIRLKWDTTSGSLADWTCTVQVGGTGMGDISPRTRVDPSLHQKIDTLLLGSEVTGQVTGEFLFDEFHQWNGHADSPDSSGTWTADLITDPAAHHGYAFSPTQTIPSGASITWEYSRDDGASWQSLDTTGGDVWLDKDSDKLKIRATLSAPDFTSVPEVSTATLTRYYQYATGVKTWQTVSLGSTFDPRKMRVSLVDDHGNPAAEVPEGTSLRIFVSPDGFTTTREISDGGTASFDPAATGAPDWRVRFKLETSPDQYKTPQVEQYKVEIIGAGENQSITYYVSRDDGTTFHEVTPGVEFTAFGGTESPKDRLKWKVVFTNSDPATTPRIDRLNFTVETGGGLDGIVEGTISSWGQLVTLRTYLESFGDLLRRVEDVTGVPVHKSFDPATGDITVDWNEGAAVTTHTIENLDDVQDVRWSRSFEELTNRIVYYGGDQ